MSKTLKFLLKLATPLARRAQEPILLAAPLVPRISSTIRTSIHAQLTALMESTSIQMRTSVLPAFLPVPNAIPPTPIALLASTESSSIMANAQASVLKANSEEKTTYVLLAQVTAQAARV